MKLMSLNDLMARTQRVGDCLEWTGEKDKDGYGLVGRAYPFRRVHRLVWFLTNGRSPKGMFVCHKCDNPSCINSDHLYLGDVNTNVRDMISNGRQAVGEKQGISKLDVESVRTILSSEVSAPEIAKQFGVSKSLVYQIRRRVIWRHVAFCSRKPA